MLELFRFDSNNDTCKLGTLKGLFVHERSKTEKMKMRRSNLRNWINKNILVVQQAQNQSDEKT